jgi:MFS family permease
MAYHELLYHASQCDLGEMRSDLLNGFEQGCMCLIGGRLADIFGGKRTCVTGMTIFVLASLGACFAQTKEALFATRGLSGLGSALATVAAFREFLGVCKVPRLSRHDVRASSFYLSAILTHIFPEGSGRTMAFALYIAAAPTGGGLGLFGSGFIAE